MGIPTIEVLMKINLNNIDDGYCDHIPIEIPEHFYPPYLGKFGKVIDIFKLTMVGTKGEVNFFDYDGDLDFSEMWLTSLKEIPIKFHRIRGSFNCEKNQLTSLIGSPLCVDDNFYCSYNQIKSLKGCPQWVGGKFICSWNKLTTLEGIPGHVGYIDGMYNSLITTKTKYPHGYHTYAQTSLENLQKHMENLLFHTPHQLDHHLRWLEDVDSDVYPKVIQGLEKCGTLSGQQKKLFKEKQPLVELGLY